jgi:hypothetical protein
MPALPNRHGDIDLHQGLFRSNGHSIGVWSSALTGVTAVARNKAPALLREPGAFVTHGEGIPMQGFAQWLEGTSASEFVQKTLWLIPLMQTIHIICVALVFSSVVMIEFRILGYTKSQSVAETAHRFVPWIFVGVVVMALTGAVLIVGEPMRSLPSFEFQMKMLFLAIALALTVVFVRSVHRDADAWADNADSGVRTAHSALAVVALAAWCAVVIWGRWIAYTVVH